MKQEQNTCFFKIMNKNILRKFGKNEIKDAPLIHIAMFNEMFPRKDNKNMSKRIEFEDEPDSFHQAMAPVLTIGQWFGILPVIGICEPDYTKLKFVWLSWTVIYTLIGILCSGFLSIMCLLRMIINGVDLSKTINLVFYGSTSITFILFLRLAKRWPDLVVSISRKERTRRLNRRPLRSRFSWCCFAVLFPALVEHILAFSSRLATAYDCDFSKNLDESYFSYCFPQIFEYTEYKLWKGIILEATDIISTFNWSFTDLFIIVMSLSITDRFNQLNNRLETLKGKCVSEQFWKSVREEYANLSELVKEIDCAINEIIFLSFANNLYFICVQLFNSLNNAHEDRLNDDCHSSIGILRGLLIIIYFGFSFGFLMLRFLTVSLGAARIHSAAFQPVHSLYAAPSSCYGTEAHRLLEQVATDNIAFTGMKLFKITRGLVLTIAGTIVTYELVLLQFNAVPKPVTAHVNINESCGVPVKVV